MGNSADGHWKLALWCEQQGLKAEANAHLAAVTQIEPGRDAAWKRLGFKRQAGRWVTDGQVAAEKAEAEAQKKADKHWMTVLSRWRKDLDDPEKQADATQSLHGVFDPPRSPRCGPYSPPEKRRFKRLRSRCSGRSIQDGQRMRCRSSQS